MKVSVARGELLEALAIVNRGLSSRSTLPILSSVLLSASGDKLSLQATDLEVSVKHTLPVKVEREGQAVVPGKLLVDIVRSMPEAAVSIDASSEDEATIVCEHSSFAVKTLHAEDFPKFPEVDTEKTIELPTDLLATAARQVARSASRDETRPILTGVLTAVEAGTLKMVATDSYRLAVREIDLGSPIEEFEVVVPGKAVEEVPKMAGASQAVTMGISENQVVFQADGTTYVSRRIEGKFPNYKQLIPSESETTLTVDREELLEAVKRVSILAQHNAPLRAKVTPESSTLCLSATTQDVGGAEEALVVQAEGQEVEIAFNAAFLIDGLTASSSETVSMEVLSPLKPGVVKSAGDERYTYILMPVRIG